MWASKVLDATLASVRRIACVRSGLITIVCWGEVKVCGDRSTAESQTHADIQRPPRVRAKKLTPLAARCCDDVTPTRRRSRGRGETYCGAREAQRIAARSARLCCARRRVAILCAQIQARVDSSRRQRASLRSQSRRAGGRAHPPTMCGTARARPARQPCRAHAHAW